MTVKQRVMRAVVEQFHRPHGMGGRAAAWVMAHRSSNRERNVWAVGLLDVAPGERVLELGFGPGVAIGELARRATGGLVAGIDHSELMVDRARRRNAAAVRTGLVDLRLGSIEAVPDFGEPFDAILAVNALLFSDDPSEVLRRLRGVLRPGGRIAIANQPRCPGATAETSAESGRRLAASLEAAGFSAVRAETLPLDPPVACVLGVNGD
ncbi:MAG TPA: methyltransferase domain-containing protein [Acidimicrobiia bacterium]